MKEKIMKEKIKKLFQSKLEFLRGTRFISFCFIGASVMIAAGILWAANMYYNIDTGEVVTEEIQRVTGVLRATASVIVGGTATQDPTAGYVFEVVGKTRLATTTIATGTLELIAANQLLKFTGGVTDYYVGFKADTSATSGQAITYTFPAAKPTNENYVLTSSQNGVWEWQSVSGVGAGDVTAVGDCPSGACFTGTKASEGGNTLYFEGTTYDDFEIALTAANPDADYTITLPAATGYVALGTSTANYVAYWTGTSTLAGTSTLPTSMGGTGQNTSGWSGLVRISTGSWSQLTGTANAVAIWSSDGTYLVSESPLSVGKGGTGKSSWTQGGVLYADTTGSLTNTGAGATYQMLTATTGAAPSWRNIYDLVDAKSGLTDDNIAPLTIKLGGTLTENTTITQGNFDMIFNLTGTGDFKVQDDGTNILTVTDDGRILYKTYPLAESGKEVLREMIPIFGFDLPSQTATTSYVQISRVIEDYPFSPTSTGATRVHKFVIRYADATTTASTTWRVYNVTDSTTTATFTVPPTATTTLAQGEVYITGAVDIPTTPNKWWRLDLYTPGTTIRVYQIFLAAYDKID